MANIDISSIVHHPLVPVDIPSSHHFIGGHHDVLSDPTMMPFHHPHIHSDGTYQNVNHGAIPNNHIDGLMFPGHNGHGIHHPTTQNGGIHPTSFVGGAFGGPTQGFNIHADPHGISAQGQGCFNPTSQTQICGNGEVYQGFHGGGPHFGGGITITHSFDGPIHSGGGFGNFGGH